MNGLNKKVRDFRSNINKKIITETKYFKYKKPFILKSEAVLDYLEIAYEIYRKLNDEKDNAISICYALTGDAHIAGYHEGAKKKQDGGMI